MIFRVIFKKIPISHKKIRILINKIRKFSILNMLIYLNFLNTKSSIILKKLILSFLYSLKLKNFDFINFKNFSFSSEKCMYFKRLFYRSKGRCSITKKKFSNILLSILN